MTASNHVLTGTAIALAIHQPLAALPLAFASHFVLDALPHFGFHGKGFKYALKQKRFYAVESLDFIGLIILVLTFNYLAWVTLAAAILAVSPDFEWFSREVINSFWHKRFSSTQFNRFHAKIQWCEKPWGFYVELVFFVVGYFLVRKYLLPAA
jgi:hypothetical protein